MFCPHAGLPPSSPATTPMSLRPILCLAVGIFRCRVYSIETQIPYLHRPHLRVFTLVFVWVSRFSGQFKRLVPVPARAAQPHLLVLVSRKWSAEVCNSQGLRWRGCNQERLNAGSGPVHCRVLRSEQTSAPPPLSLHACCRATSHIRVA